jgi:hypothetical protein
VPPVQLRLLPDQVPTPLPDLIGQFPENDVAAVVALLADLIARAQAAGAAREAGDERAREDQRLAPVADGGDLCPPLHLDPGGAEHRVDRPPV